MTANLIPMNSLFLALESTIVRLNRICLWVKSLPPEARATRGPLFVHLLEAGSLGTLAIGPMGMMNIHHHYLYLSLPIHQAATLAT